MTALEVLVDQPVLHGRTVRLEPLGPDVLEDYLRGLQDPEVRRLTGTHAVHDRAAVERWLRGRAAEHDRADWAVVRASDGQFLGEAVVHELDVDNASAGYRVWLSGPDARGQGHGTEVTQLVVAFALDVLGLHRLALEVFEHNGRARRAYETCGFVVEGRLRDALLWEGRRHDALVMSVLRTDARPGRAAGRGRA